MTKYLVNRSLHFLTDDKLLAAIFQHNSLRSVVDWVVGVERAYCGISRRRRMVLQGTYLHLLNSTANCNYIAFVSDYGNVVCCWLAGRIK